MMLDQMAACLAGGGRIEIRGFGSEAMTSLQDRLVNSNDEVLAQARKRRQSAEAVLETLFEAEAAERRARSTRYRMGQAHFPLQCDLGSFEFGESRVDETQLRTLYEGEFITELRNLIFIGGTGTGKTHLAIAIAMHAVRERSRVRFFNLVDLANQLELAVVGLDDVVEVLHLPVPRLVRAFALGFQLRDGAGVGRRLVGVQHLGQLPVLQSVQSLAEESLRGLGVAGR